MDQDRLLAGKAVKTEYKNILYATNPSNKPDRFTSTLIMVAQSVESKKQPSRKKESRPLAFQRCPRRHFEKYALRDIRENFAAGALFVVLWKCQSGAMRRYEIRHAQP